MKSLIFILCVIFSIVLGGIVFQNAMANSSQATLRCINHCAAQKNNCIGYCQGDATCISNCASMYGNCVNGCY